MRVEEDANMTTEDFLLSAVIPVRDLSGKLQNFEKTIRLAIKSGVQVIAIHDGNYNSTEEELLTLQDKLKPHQFELVTKNLGAPGLARNEGLQMVRGRYVAFWDADDLAQVANILISLEKNQLDWDILIGQYIVMDSTNQIRIGIKSEHFNLLQVAINPGLWRMVFRREFLDNLRFSSAIMGEDQEFFAQCLAKSPSVFYSESLFYEYFVHVGGQLTSKTEAVLTLASEIPSATILQKNTKDYYLDAQLIMQIRKIFTISRLRPLRSIIIIVLYISESIRIGGFQVVPKILKAFRFVVLQLGKK